MNEIPELLLWMLEPGTDGERPALRSLGPGLRHVDRGVTVLETRDEAPERAQEALAIGTLLELLERELLETIQVAAAMLEMGPVLADGLS